MRSSRLAQTGLAVLALALVAFVFMVPAGAADPVPPSISINDVTMNEGNSGTTNFVFTVTLSDPPAGNFTIMVNYATANGTAIAGACSSGFDYLTTSGQLTFNRNNLTRTVTVPVCGDAVFEPNETFFVNLSNPTGGATITKGQGVGTIVNDDVAPLRSTSTNVTCVPATVPVLGTTTCTATVTDTDAGTSTPKGTVTFSLVSDDGETGAFTPVTGTCMLNPTATGDSNSCSVDYTPATVGDGTHEIGASYTPTDGIHAASSDPTPFQLGVRKRMTSTSVSCTPPTIEAGGSTSCTATVTDTDAGTSTPQGTVTFSATGSGNSFLPAPTCMLDPTATGDSNSCSVSYSSTQAATHTITASYSGSLTHQESTGMTTVTVEPGPPFEVVVDPPTAINDVDTQHCVTAKVTDRFGNPTPGITVIFSVRGSNTADGSRTTDSTGKTGQFCYTGVLIGITDVITAFADFDPMNSMQDPGEPFGTATKVWRIPVSTPLCEVTITQGGWIIASNGDRASFGGNAQVSNTGEPTGQEEFQDHGPAQPMNVKSTKIVAVLCSDDLKQATIFGLATINGSGEFAFRIDVQDLAEPGVGQDTYRMRIGLYDSGEPGTLAGGNVQIHKL
jgi:hypothetical protein